MELEKRIYNLDKLEVRADEETGVPSSIVGHAAVFDKLSVDLGGFKERIKRGAFNNAIKDGDDVRALWNHNPDLVLGRTPDTLKLREDDAGLRMEIDLDGAPEQVRDLTRSIQRGDVTQASFAFNLRSENGDSWHEEEDGTMIRTLLDLRLSDVSPVTYPAYPDTDVATRSLTAYRESKAEEVPETMTVQQARTLAILRSHGLSLG